MSRAATSAATGAGTAPVRRTGVAAVLLVAVVGLLSGCVSIPDDGPIVQGRALIDAQRPPRVKFYESYPITGADPARIVQGFIRAAKDFSGDHEVARSYLTPDQRTRWRPNEAVVVYRGEATVTELDPSGTAASPTVPSPSATPSPTPSASPPAPGARTTVRVEVSVAARVDGTGIYRPSEAGDVARMTLTLAAVDGQWRIQDAVDGVLISEDDFLATFADVPLYFPEATGRWLIPDVRWFPVTALPSVVISALLEGPSPWLTPAVSTGAPPGTALTAAGVRIGSGTLSVDLNRQALLATAAQRQLLSAQVQTTLTEAARVLGFPSGQLVLTVDRVRFEVPQLAAPVPQPADAVPFDGRPVVLDAQHRLARMEGTRVVPVPGLATLGEDATRPAVNADGTAYAVLTTGGTRLVTVQSDGGARSVLSNAVGLTAPSFDTYGWVWTSPVVSAGTVTAVRGGVVVEVAVPWLSGYAVSTLKISREGTRALIVAHRGRRSSVLVVSLVRSADGAPRRMATAPLRLASDLPVVRDASWLDGRRVMLLAIGPGSQVERLHLAEIGGRTLAGASVVGALSLTVGVAPADAWVQTAKGAAYYSGVGLRQVAGARWPAMPG